MNRAELVRALPCIQASTCTYTDTHPESGAPGTLPSTLERERELEKWWSRSKGVRPSPGPGGYARDSGSIQSEKSLNKSLRGCLPFAQSQACPTGFQNPRRGRHEKGFKSMKQ